MGKWGKYGEKVNMSYIEPICYFSLFLHYLEDPAPPGNYL